MVWANKMNGRCRSETSGKTHLWPPLRRAIEIPLIPSTCLDPILTKYTNRTKNTSRLCSHSHHVVRSIFTQPFYAYQWCNQITTTWGNAIGVYAPSTLRSYFALFHSSRRTCTFTEYLCWRISNSIILVARYVIPLWYAPVQAHLIDACPSLP